MGDKYKSAVHGISVLILKGLCIHCESIPLVFLVDYSREQVVLFWGCLCGFFFYMSVAKIAIFMKKCLVV